MKKDPSVAIADKYYTRRKKREALSVAYILDGDPLPRLLVGGEGHNSSCSRTQLLLLPIQEFQTLQQPF
jgi:hypothetical protein